GAVTPAFRPACSTTGSQLPATFLPAWRTKPDATRTALLPHIASASELQHQHGDVVRLRGPLGKRGHRLLHGVVNRHARLTGASGYHLAQTFLAEECGRHVL